MDIKQTLKDLQAQNAQLQQMFLALSKGQEDLKTLMIKEKKKKAKKPVSVLNLGRRFKGPSRRTLDFITSLGEGDNQEGKNKEVNDHPESEEKEEVDYSEKQYPQLMINTSSWRISSMIWKSRGYPDWILKS